MVPKEGLQAEASTAALVEVHKARELEMQLGEHILVVAIGLEDMLVERTLVGLAEVAQDRLVEDRPVEGDKALELEEQAVQ